MMLILLFCYFSGLLNDAFSVVTTQRLVRGWLMNDELEMIYKIAILA
jgi:hypothetical protein